MKTILGIETSCDETAAAVVMEKRNSRFNLLGAAIASSEEIHKKYGGIIPEKAAREQLKAILPVIKETLGGIHPQGGFDAIAVTAGPGLIGSLIVGIEVAKTLSFILKKPLIPVNHLLAHLYVNFLDKKSCHSGANPDKHRDEAIESPLDFNERDPIALRQAQGSRMTKELFPSIGLIVSGGHTDLLLFKSIINYKWLGGTRDDAAGECFDKCARLLLLGLGYPGGPEIEACASKFKIKNEKLKIVVQNLILPRPMIKESTLDFSFSGLKTAVLRIVKKRNQFSHLTIQQFNHALSFEIQEAITDVLVEKTIRAAKKYRAKSILCGGGVIANSCLRKKLQVASCKLQVKLFLPEKPLCTDNAVGVAIAGFFGKEVSWKNLRPDPGLEF